MQERIRRIREWLAPRSSWLGWAAVLAIVLWFHGRAVLDNIE
jgi:hypothetical protein